MVHEQQDSPDRDSSSTEPELEERLKELAFLHQAARLLNLRGDARDMMRAVVEHLPSALRGSQYAAARICFGQLEVRSRGYVPGPLSMRADFELDAERRGFVEVCYPAHGSEVESFLPEERALLASCAELVKAFLQRTGADLLHQKLQEAEAAEQAALAESRAKDQFLSVVAHELRSSLHVMLGWVQMLKSTQQQGATIVRGLEILERNVKLQAKLIEDLLDLSRILSGKLTLDPRRLDLAELVAFAVDAKRPSAQSKQLELAADLEPVGHVWADPQRLQQVVYNVLGNAIKFTPPGGQVAVSARRLGSMAIVSIRDTGQGIAPELLPHIFEWLRQADGDGGRSGGLGLGLAIARRLVELHRGTISASSAGPGRGATFDIVLPLHLPVAP